MELAIIYKNDESINFDNINIREQIDDILDTNIKFEEFSTEEEMFTLIHNALNNPSVGVTVSNIWEDIDTIYAGYFIDIAEIIDYNDENKSKNIQLNVIGSQITSQHVTSNLVIVKKKLSYDIVDNNIKSSIKPDNLTYNQLLDTLEKVFIKEGIAIDPDDSMRIYKYITNPLEHLMLTDPKYMEHYIYHEYEVYNHVLIIIVDLREKHGKYNQIASYLSGRPCNGTVFIGIYKKPDSKDNPLYSSLSINILNKILTIRKKSTSLTTGMSPSENEYVNFEKLLDEEIKKHYFKPDVIISGPLLNLDIDINATGI